MQTEFTCGIYRVAFDRGVDEWPVYVNAISIGRISEDGSLLKFHSTGPYLSQYDLIEIAVLMNNIKRQHKQLNQKAFPDQRGQGFDGIVDEE